MLNGKKILIGVTASIAAYKAAFLVRLFIKEGAQVRVVITPAAKDFVTPLTLATLSKNPVEHLFVEDLDAGTWNNHVELGLWADLMVIAPATANTLSKMAHGTCNNLLMAVYMSSKCPVYVAPAMDLDMYKHKSTLANIVALESFGNVIIPAASGELASGLEGEGRMAEPEEIISFIKNHRKNSLPLNGKKVLINAGPTYENIDDVRFIGNYSSGKMGVALAQTAMQLGADVHLVLGPTATSFDLKGLEVTRVVSAEEMFNATTKLFVKSNIAILSAAVADYTPQSKFVGKIKKTSSELTIELKKTKDILAFLGQEKNHDQVLVGFALESTNEENYAKEKLHKKNADLIVLNSLQDKGAGFGVDTNKVKIFNKNGLVLKTKTLSKMEVAQEIWNTILEKYV